MPPTASAHPVLDETIAALPALMTRPETAAFLRCGPDHISGLINAGELQALQRRVVKGSPILIPRSSILAYLGRISR
jgi:hypothetical protein